MEQTPFDIVSIAVELIITLLIISFISTCMFIGLQMVKSYQREADIANSMQDYAMYTKYDGTIVSGSDVIEAIYMYTETIYNAKGEVENYVFSIQVGSKLYTSANYTLEKLVEDISLNSDYSSDIVISSNGEIVGINFEEAD